MYQLLSASIIPTFDKNCFTYSADIMLNAPELPISNGKAYSDLMSPHQSCSDLLHVCL